MILARFAAPKVRTLWAGLLALSWCIALPAAPADARSVAEYRQKVQLAFHQWLNGLWTDAEKNGVSQDTFIAAFKGMKLNWSLPELIPPAVDGYPKPPQQVKRAQKKKKRQPEFDVPAHYFPNKYLSSMAAQGRSNIAKWKDELGKIETDYGVQKSIIMAIWGRETAFGKAKLRHDAIRSLATEAFMGLRKDYFRTELLSALNILEQKHVARSKMVSSWAGAMGHTQFMPLDFERYAVDFDGDGKRDIWSTIPDAFASTANYLKSEGWEYGKTWGYEIKQAKSLNCTDEGPWQGRTIKEWIGLGAKRTHGRDFSPDQLNDTAYLLMPAGTYGPAFLVLKNFYVIKQYNYADLYALYVGHVADRMGQDRKFEGRWNKVDRFTRDEMRALQRALTKKGFYDDKIDGFIGSKSRVSIGQYQASQKLPVTCYPSRAELKRLLASTN